MIPTVVGLTASSYLRDNTSPEEQALKDQFAEAVVQANCGPTGLGNISGFSQEAGSQKALDILKKAYPEEEGRLEIYRFLADNKVVLHATSAADDNVYAAFFNNPEAGQRTLLVQAGVFKWKDYSEPLRDLIETMKTDEALLKMPGTSIIFDNKSTGALDWMRLSYTHTLNNMSVFPETAKLSNAQGQAGDMSVYSKGRGFNVNAGNKTWHLPCAGYTIVKPLVLDVEQGVTTPSP